MIYIPMCHLKAGMILARDIILDSTFIPYISSGQPLTNVSISKLNKFHVPGAYISSRICDDIIVTDLVDPEIKKEISDGLNKIFLSTIKEKSLSFASANLTAQMASDLVANILEKDEQIFNIIDMKKYSEYSYTHSTYVAILSSLIGINLGFDRKSLVELATAGLLHDIGNLSISKSLLDKKGELTTDEFKIVKSHPLLSVKKLRHCCTITSQSISGIVAHHERYDGTGYPNALTGSNIPLYGRILALADVYDALTSERPFRSNPYPPNEAIEYMMSQSATMFDPELLNIFLHCVTAYPVGTLTKLSNDCLAVVVKNTPSYPLRPTIRVLSPESEKGSDIDLSTDSTYRNVTILSTEDGSINEFFDLNN